VIRHPDEPLDPSRFRWPICVSALIAWATWCGVGLPYSLFAWLLDAEQLRWVLICYAWEVPLLALLGPFLLPLRWFHDIERRWKRVFADSARGDQSEAAALEGAILDYPARVASVLLIASLVGYGLGALQLRLFAQLPSVETAKIVLLGLVTGLVGALLAVLCLEWLLEPLARHLGSVRAGIPPAGRHVPLYAKAFAGSLVLTIAALLLLGTVFYTRGERILEEQIGRRLLVEARYLATDLSQQGRTHATERTWWREHTERIHLGPSGYAYLIDASGAVVAGTTGPRSLDVEGFRPSVVRAILTGGAGHLVDRVYDPRIIAFAELGDSELRVVTVAYRREFAAELDRMLQRGGVVFVLAMLLALSQGFLFSRGLTRPIESLTAMASTIARAPGRPWEKVPVRTNDEVGELATAFNHMTARLEEARGELERHSADLERRVADATSNIATLYDITRTTTSTLEIEDVLKLIAEKTLATLGLPRLVLLWRPPDSGDVADAYATSAGGVGKRLDVEEAIDLRRIRPASPKPMVVPVASFGTTLPAGVTATLASRNVLCLPLVFKEQLLGVILGSLEDVMVAPDLELAAALTGQAATALANASLFETARRHEAELRTLSQARVQLQEESLRTLSRELHDGVGQVLTAIKLDLDLIEHAAELDTATVQARAHGIRQQVTNLMQEIRTMSQLLRPSMLDDFGLVPTLQWLVETFAARTHIAVDLRTPPAETRLPGAIEVLLYRITQEALTNVTRHAQAHNVEVELAVGNGEAMLTIADDGVGFDVERFRRTPALAGVGLLGMRERVAYYRGRIDIRSRPQAGVRITLSVPIDAVTTSVEGASGRMPLAG
jgi:two-component system NarL family sensor kinase